MAVIDPTKFKGVTSIGNTLLMNELENNLKIYIDWSMLGVGAWSDVTINTTGAFGGNLETLRFEHDPSYTDGQVWQGFRKDWVWETGVGFDDAGNNPEPVIITGVQVSGIMYGTGDATFGHHINYPLGRVIFDTAIPTGSPVKSNFSYRFVQVYKADDAPWWTELQFRSFRADDLHFTQEARTGNWAIGDHHRIQLPAVILETVPRRRSRGYELGNGAMIVEQDVIFHILAENRWDRNQIMDILSLQNEKTIWLFDSDLAVASTGFPLDFRGMKIGTNMYPDLISGTGDGGFQWRRATFLNTEGASVESFHPKLFEGTVKTTMEVVFTTM